MRPLVLMSLAATLMLAGGCKNSCQKICTTMRNVAEDECGITVDKDDYKACIKGQAGKESRGDRKVCREFGDEETILQEWSCDDIVDYFEGGGSTGDGGGDTGE